MSRDFPYVHRVLLTGCGTAWHAALIGEYLFEELARIPTDVAYASELRYRNPILEEGTIAIALSQSGETADTLAALREVRMKGAWHRERGWVHDRAGNRRGCLSARGCRNRRREYEGFYRASCRSGFDGY